MNILSTTCLILMVHIALHNGETIPDGWVLHQPGITAPVLGMRSLDHLEDAAAALPVTFSEEEQEYLAAPYNPRPVLGHE